MRGKYTMMDWEVEKWRQRLTVAIAELIHDKSKAIDFTQDDVCPANIIMVLEKKGWTKEDMEDNGWQHDTWYTFSHPDYNFNLILYYEGYLFSMNLYRSDIDD